LYHIDKIVSSSIVSADIMCTTGGSAPVNKGRITQEIKGHSRPVTAKRAPHNTGEGWRGGRRETVTWYQPPRRHSTGSCHQRQMTPHPLHQQELITTVSTVNHS